MIKIVVLPRQYFEQLWESLTGKQRSESAFISIRDGGFPLISPDADNFLNLQFDDADDEAHWSMCTLFNEEMATQIKEFTDKNKDKRVFFVHCLMGISRSGAVGEWLNDYFGNDYFDFKRTNPHIIPNSLVKRILYKS